MQQDRVHANAVDRQERGGCDRQRRAVAAE
jgi:hypothetical protein